MRIKSLEKYVQKHPWQMLSLLVAFLYVGFNIGPLLQSSSTKAQTYTQAYTLLNQVVQISAANLSYHQDTGKNASNTLDLVESGYLTSVPSPSSIADKPYALDSIDRSIRLAGVTSTVCQETERIASEIKTTVDAKCVAPASTNGDEMSLVFKAIKG